MKLPGLASLATMVLLSACGLGAARVPLVGPRIDTAGLAGEWKGDYTGEQTQRRGLITFRITSHGDSASGDVEMLLPDSTEAVPFDKGYQHLQHVASIDYLDITFVAVRGGRVEGRLEPYLAPGCECVAYTAFSGTLKDDVIAGTFMTVTSTGEVQRGRWQVRRVRRAP